MNKKEVKILSIYTQKAEQLVQYYAQYYVNIKWVICNSILGNRCAYYFTYIYWSRKD